MVNFCPQPLTFCLSFILFSPVWIRIHKVPEYGTNLGPDPDPQDWFYHCCGGGAGLIRVEPEPKFLGGSGS